MEIPTDPSTRRASALWKRLFLSYFAVLTVLLLWPKLQLPSVIERPDLWVHYMSFGLFTLLLSLWNPRSLARPWPAGLLGMAAGVAYGGITELLQMIPIVKRTAAWDDWAADSFGALCGLIAFALVHWVAARYAAGGRRTDS